MPLIGRMYLDLTGVDRAQLYLMLLCVPGDLIRLRAQQVMAGSSIAHGDRTCYGLADIGAKDLLNGASATGSDPAVGITKAAPILQRITRQDIGGQISGLGSMLIHIRHLPQHSKRPTGHCSSRDTRATGTSAPAHRHRGYQPGTPATARACAAIAGNRLSRGPGGHRTRYTADGRPRLANCWT